MTVLTLESLQDELHIYMERLKRQLQECIKDELERTLPLVFGKSLPQELEKFLQGRQSGTHEAHGSHSFEFLQNRFKNRRTERGSGAQDAINRITSMKAGLGSMDSAAAHSAVARMKSRRAPLYASEEEIEPPTLEDSLDIELTVMPWKRNKSMVAGMVAGNRSSMPVPVDRSSSVAAPGSRLSFLVHEGGYSSQDIRPHSPVHSPVANSLQIRPHSPVQSPVSKPRKEADKQESVQISTAGECSAGNGSTPAAGAMGSASGRQSWKEKQRTNFRILALVQQNNSAQALGDAMGDDIGVMECLGEPGDYQLMPSPEIKPAEAEEKDDNSPTPELLSEAWGPANDWAWDQCSLDEEPCPAQPTNTGASRRSSVHFDLANRDERSYEPETYRLDSQDMEELVDAAEALAPQEMLELCELAQKLFCNSDVSTVQEKPTIVRDDLQVCAHVGEMFGDSPFKPALYFSCGADTSYKITDNNFCIQRRPKSAQQSWRSRYTLEAKVGDGSHATVYKARTIPTRSEKRLDKMCCGWQVDATAVSKVANREKIFSGSCAAGQGRVVAAKLFNECGSQAFKQEQEAMRLVSVHPNIARLLESFQNDHREDVLILEMFDCDLYDLYRHWFYPMSAQLYHLIVKAMKQILLAIDHLIRCGVNHRDVKLENIMVYNLGADPETIDIKLGDFGWACATDQSVKQQVCGTPWYAPPEISPAIPGIKSNVSTAQVPTGLSDMWSVGVIAYLLHVGHNPFKHLGKDTTIHSGMRYMAEGKFDTESIRWKRLAPEARNFIQRLLRVDPHARPTPSEILEHQYFTKYSRSVTTSEVMLQARVVPSHTRWEDLDGLQRLGWVAMARAVAEPELNREVVLTARLPGSATRDSSAYLLQLAKELAIQPVENMAWLNVLVFAFRYLDADGDDLLSAQDLACHMYDSNDKHSNNSQCQAAAELWVHRWSWGKGLHLLEFRKALLNLPHAPDLSKEGATAGLETGNSPFAEGSTTALV